MVATLSQYLTRTKQLLQNPSSAASKLFTDSDLTTYINIGRSQIAGEGECIRNFASLTLAPNTRAYNFSSIALGSPSTGVSDVFNVRQALFQIGSGQGGQGYQWLHPRSFPWFTLYKLNNIVPPEGPPSEWSQFGQGVTGSIYIDPVPDQAYVISLDTVCQPVDLVDDSTPEAIPYPWTDAVPFYACYYAYMSAQRQADSDMSFKRFEQYMARARAFSNPDVVPQAYSQPGQDPTMAGRLGVKQGRQSGGQ